MRSIPEIAQYITFRLGNELFAIDVSQVREVLDLTTITKVPSAPAFMRGVVNVRGNAIPVIDLRQRFGLPLAAETVNTRILVLELELDGERAVLGGIADSVHEVLELTRDRIAPPPAIAMRWRSEFILGMSRQGEEFIILLDSSAVFSAAELTSIAETGVLAAPETGDRS